MVYPCRSKTFDHSLLTQVKTDADSKTERKKSHYSQVSRHQVAKLKQRYLGLVNGNNSSQEKGVYQTSDGGEESALIFTACFTVPDQLSLFPTVAGTVDQGGSEEVLPYCLSAPASVREGTSWRQVVQVLLFWLHQVTWCRHPEIQQCHLHISGAR